MCSNSLKHFPSRSRKLNLYRFTSFIESHGQPLLDLSLYVSSDNYTSTTRPALSQLLQWPGQWFTSPEKRSLAKARTDHLGLSSLDLDNANEPNTKPSTPAISDVIPQSLRTSRQTVTSLAQQPQHAARFRLEALADGFFEPLQELLGNKRYMLSEDQPSSLDAVAVASLALMLIPQVPQKWFAETMTSRYPVLCVYVRRSIKEYFGGPVKLNDAIMETHSEACYESQQRSKIDAKFLPWGKPARKGVRDAGSALLKGTLFSLPMAEHFNQERVLLARGDQGPSSSGVISEPGKFQPLVVPSLLALGSVFAAVGSYFLYTDVMHSPAPAKRNLSDMGDAGAMLGMGLFGDHNASSISEKHQEGRVPVGLEMDFEVDEATAR